MSTMPIHTVSGQITGGYRVYAWDEVRQLWDQVSGGGQPVTTYFTIKSGFPAYHFPHMQDHWREGNVVNNDGLLQPPQTEFNLLSSLWTANGQATVFSNSYLFTRAQPVGLSDQYPFQEPGLPFLSHTARSMYELLSVGPRTRSIIIREDPFEGEFSVWFLLVDLIQLPKLAVSLRKAWPRLRALSQAFSKGKDTGRAFGRQVANSHLAVTFGLIPTIQDLKTFVEIMVGWAGKYSALNGKLKRGFTAHGPILRGANIMPSGVIVRDMEVRHLGESLPLRMTINVPDAQLYQTTKYHFVCPELSGILNRIKQLVDGLGLLDPAAAWDLIPFSFIVDWFFPVGEWVHKNLKPRLFSATILIDDWCESIGRDCVWDLRLLPHRAMDPSGPGFVTAPEVIIASGTHRQYARKRQFPKQLGVTVTERPELKNSVVTVRRVLISGSLVAQRLFKHKAKTSPSYAWRLVKRFRLLRRSKSKGAKHGKR